EKHQLEIIRVNGRPMCQFNGAPPEKRYEWPYDSPIVSIEASQSASRKPQLISGLKSGEDSTHLDSTDTMLPRWVLEVRNRKRSSRLVFMPLDVRGVEFTVRFPSAKSRLDNEQ
ncbi:MAG TPA: hypothetical protein VKB27_04890, partial [Gammaproteobacteria bacterium]|nr:hypothetical protein [Gammaproteobacteria bacterium]